MKALGNMILIVFMTLMLLVSSFFVFGVTTEKGESINRRQVLQKDYHTISTGLDAASLYLKTALRYAVYQALYEANLEKKVWYNNGKANITEDFENKTRSKLDSVLVRYTRDPYTFLDGTYLVFLPEYKSSVKIENNALRVSATTDQRLSIEKSRPKENIILEKTVPLSDVFSYKPIALAAEFLNGLNGTDFINSTATSYFNTTWKTKGAGKIVGCENKNMELENIDVFNDIHNTSFANFTESENKIGSELSDKISNLSPFNISGIKLTLQPNSIITVASSCVVDRQDLCNQSNPYYTYTKICNFSYRYAINTTVSIEDMEAIYPIKPEKESITFVPQRLVFDHILDGEYK